MKKLLSLGIISIILLCTSASAFSKDIEDEVDVFAIQNKIFHRHHELGVVLGYIPDDDFYEVYPGGLSYTFHLNDFWAFDIRGQVISSDAKDLKSELESVGATPSIYRELKQLAHAHLIVKPFYGKDAIRNRGIINNETYIFLGGGSAAYENHQSYGESTSESAFSLSFGIGTKYFVNKKMCINFEIRDMMNYRDDKTVNNIWFGISFGYRFNFKARKIYGDTTLQTLHRYLGKDNSHEK